MTPQSQAIRRSPRVLLRSATPAVFRSLDGGHMQGELRMFSLTGGLVCLSETLDYRSVVKVRFVTHAGTIHASAEMLKPVSRDLQPFRFVAIRVGDERKLRAVIQSYLRRNHDGDESVDSYRARLVPETFFGSLLGYDLAGDDLLSVNRNPEQNCPVCGIAGHKHTARMTKECATKLVRGDDQTGKPSEPSP
jgi:hypothetical protein